MSGDPWPPTGVPGARVLLVEDEPMIGRILEHKLSREGHAVTWLRTAADAAVALDAGGIDVALVDVTLESDGVDLAAAHPTPRAGWLALVEARRHDDATRAIGAGARGVVLKPFKPTAVAAQVEALLEAAG